MLAQLLKILYICTFILDRQRAEVVTQRGGKKKHPTHEVPTTKDQCPLSKVKTVMQVPPSGRNFDKIAEKN